MSILTTCAAKKRPLEKTQYVVKKLMDIRGGPENRFYKVWWEGYNDSDETTWEPLGHILRLDDDRMLKQAILSMKKTYPEGSILMDAPPHDSIQELVDLAGDHGWENHKEWTSYVKEFSKNFVEFPDEVSSDDTSDVEDTTENSDSDWD